MPNYVASHVKLSNIAPPVLQPNLSTVQDERVLACMRRCKEIKDRTVLCISNPWFRGEIRD